MELDNARTLVVGATGVLGGKLGRGLVRNGARLVLAGRDEQRLAAVADELGDCPTERFDADDLDTVGGMVDRAAGELGGLDLMVALTCPGSRAPRASGRRVAKYRAFGRLPGSRGRTPASAPGCGGR